MKKVIGIDIGGTKILGGVIGSNGDLIKFKETSTDANLGRDHILKKLFGVLDDLFDTDIEGIGIGSAGRINFNTGEVIYATDNLPGWTGINLKEIISQKYKTKTIVENDVNAAIIGENWVGSAKNYRDILMITLGTGVGGAIILDGKLIRGSHFSAAEIGHTILYPDGKRCNCGHNGCVEQYISGTAIYKRYNELAGSNMVNSAKDVFDLYMKNDKMSKLVVDEFIKSLSLLIFNIRNFIDPEIIILGGGVTNSKDLWWEYLKSQIKCDLNISIAGLNNFSTAYGAAKLILNEGVV
ncbi:ROK family protein [Thermoanaerobacterium thermosaccharolyticum]|uniref:ROK family protein n=1 Tax=Thermoanaerobacterium thermosaccharolyticum TaxID=1517 RepID=UPI001784B361|nr:ROK family protein [Thermoanaerobacterium thermosaccharolyticum]MBE0070067.1 ROK family protein [Thermoanaerobacterium thermosaccharolyticum]MBE0227918.1 ROK family protein [Thermoanaerobacterium thermosaccharolyticum]